MIDPARALPLGSPATWAAILAALAFLGFGLRALARPAPASAFFGIAVSDGPGLGFVQVYGARMVGIAALALALVALDARAALAALLMAGALMAALDALVVAARGGARKAAKHALYTLAFGGFGLWLALR